MDSEWRGIVEGVSDQLINGLKASVGETWDLIPDRGKHKLFVITELLAEAEIRRMAGQDVPIAALKAALTNWRMVGRINAAKLTDETIDQIEAALFTVAKVLFAAGIAAL